MLGFAGERVSQALLRALRERNPEDEPHGEAVARLVAAVEPLLEEPGGPPRRSDFESLCEPSESRSSWMARSAGDGGSRRRFRLARWETPGSEPGERELWLRAGAPEGLAEAVGLDRVLRAALAGRPAGTLQVVLDLNPRGLRREAAGALLQRVRDELREPELEPVEPLTWPPAGARAERSLARLDAEGRSVVAFARLLVADRGLEWRGLRCALSGTGPRSLAALREAARSGARVVALADEEGALLIPYGLPPERAALVADWLLARRRPLRELAERRRDWSYRSRAMAWAASCEVALALGRGDEVGVGHALEFADGQAQVVCEGTPGACTGEARAVLQEAGIAFAPCAAATVGALAGGDEPPTDAALERLTASAHLRCRARRREGDREDLTAGLVRAVLASLADAEPPSASD